MRIEMEHTEEEKQQEEALRQEAAERKVAQKVKYSKKEQWDKFMALPNGEKFWYLWEYYKVPFFLIVGGIILAVMAVNTLTEALKPVVLEGVMINVDYRSIDTDFLTKEYMIANDIDTSANKLALDVGLEISDGAVSDYQLASVTKVIALLESKDLDFMIMDTYAFDRYSEEGALMDLSEGLSKDLYDSLNQAGLIKEGELGIEYSKEDDSLVKSEPHPYGVILNKTHADDEMLFLTDPVYFGIVATTERGDKVIDYLKYLVEEPVSEQ